MTPETHPEEAWLNALQQITLSSAITPLHKAHDLLIRSKHAGQDLGSPTSNLPKDKSAYCDLVNTPDKDLPNLRFSEIALRHSEDVDECLRLVDYLVDRIQRLFDRKHLSSGAYKLMPQDTYSEQEAAYDEIFKAAIAHTKKEDA